MSFTLYSATVPTFQQILGAVSGLLDRGEAWCAEQKVAPEDVIQARLAPDMLPFAYQVKSTVAHSIGAIEGVRKGVFSPDMVPPPETFAALKQQVEGAIAALAQVTPAEVDAFVGRDMRFEFKERTLPFTAEDFLLSFSLPNFYFHATTTYDVLRWKGVPVGKRDFMGRLRLKKG
jgi:hypothetical protein